MDAGRRSVLSVLYPMQCYLVVVHHPVTHEKQFLKLRSVTREDARELAQCLDPEAIVVDDIATPLVTDNGKLIKMALDYMNR